jgi:hypothetical protein
MTAAEAKAALLDRSDLPPGWVSRTVGPSTARGTRPAACEPLVGALSKAGRQARAEASFSAPAGIPQISEILVSYRTGAAAKLKPLPALLRKCRSFTQLASGGDLRMTAAPLPFPTIGDRTFAVRLTMTLDKTDYTADLIYVAVGDNALRFNIVTATPMSDAEVARIVRAGVARLGSG